LLVIVGLAVGVAVGASKKSSKGAAASDQTIDHKTSWACVTTAAGFCTGFLVPPHYVIPFVLAWAAVSDEVQ